MIDVYLLVIIYRGCGAEIKDVVNLQCDTCHHCSLPLSLSLSGCTEIVLGFSVLNLGRQLEASLHTRVGFGTALARNSVFYISTVTTADTATATAADDDDDAVMLMMMMMTSLMTCVSLVLCGLVIDS